MRIFLFSGRAGVGKTTCSKLFKSEIENNSRTNVYIYSFASTVKDIAKLFGWDGIKDNGGRALLQGIGNIGRTYNPDIFVKRLVVDYLMDEDYKNATILIDDWRFPNEYHYLKKIFPDEDIYKIKIISPNMEILKNTPYYNDDSETALLVFPDDNFDCIFMNKEGINNAINFIKNLYEYYFNKNYGGFEKWIYKV